MNVGDSLPELFIEATNGYSNQLSALKGQWLIFYFYPKDATAGCTVEAQDFRDLTASFKQKNAQIFGISRDSLKSHESFKAKQALPFELISDASEALCLAFDVIKMKSMYGKTVRGIERSTFIIDPQGTIQKIWRKVSVKGHAEEVLSTLESLQAST